MQIQVLVVTQLSSFFLANQTQIYQMAQNFLFFSKLFSLPIMPIEYLEIYLEYFL